MGRDFALARGGVRGSRLLLACFVASPLLVSSLASAQQAAAPGDSSAEVMTRGPVHEAFAAPLVHDPKPGPIIGKTPPRPVEEMPPDQRPEGDEVQWIPGYWQWDAGRNDFLWISGVWRDPPPGCEWVPGYWNSVQGGAQWVPGSWVPIQSAAPAQAEAAAQSTRPAYLPGPPATLEVGPSSPAPSNEVFWSPGCWMWQGARYVWRPGFWAAVQPGWVWMPAHYVWTPTGYLFVPGYWDLPLATRGVMFAPVYYPTPVYLQPGYVFTPSITIVSSSFTANLFVQPAYSHYCFGDYYAQSFLSIGIVPWFSMTVVSGPSYPRFYDPLFSYYSVVNVRRDPQWITRVREDYVVRRDNVAMRPPRTYVEQTRIVRVEGPRGNVRERVTVVARPLGELPRYQREEAHSLRLERVDTAQRQRFQQRTAELNTFRQQRIQTERENTRLASTAGGPGQGPRANQPRPMNLPRSPVAAREAVTDRGVDHQAARERPSRGVENQRTVRSEAKADRGTRLTDGLDSGARARQNSGELTRAGGANRSPNTQAATPNRPVEGGTRPGAGGNPRQNDMAGQLNRESRVGQSRPANPVGRPNLESQGAPGAMARRQAGPGINPGVGPGRQAGPGINPGASPGPAGRERRVPAHPMPYQQRQRAQGKDRTP